jgi:phage major head subunit gpT-like protein
MLINSSSLRTLRTTLSALYQEGYDSIDTAAADAWMMVATKSPSDGADQEYGWLADAGGPIREWVGDRVINSIKEFGYTIKNKDFERTLGVGRNLIDDNRLASINMPSKLLGQDVRRFPNTLVFDLLKRGFTEECYDGQYMFDTDHPWGNNAVVSNVQSGSGEPWVLLDSSRLLKPIIYQERSPFKFTALFKDDDPNVFHQKEYLFGVDGRCNVGFGFWQTCFGSKAALDEANFTAARTAMMKLKNEKGQPMGIVPDTLIVGPDNSVSAMKLIEAQLNQAGGTNVFKGKVKVVETAWMAV